MRALKRLDAQTVLIPSLWRSFSRMTYAATGPLLDETARRDHAPLSEACKTMQARGCSKPCKRTHFASCALVGV